MGEPDGPTRRGWSGAQLLRTTELGVEHAADIRRAVWEKLVLNVADERRLGAYAPSDLADRSGAELRGLVVALVEETLAVAGAQGWDLARRDRREATVGRFEVPNVTPSMLQDVLLGRPLEVEAIVGQVQAFGLDAGVERPCSTCSSRSCAGSVDHERDSVREAEGRDVNGVRSRPARNDDEKVVRRTVTCSSVSSSISP